LKGAGDASLNIVGNFDIIVLAINYPIGGNCCHLLSFAKSFGGEFRPQKQVTGTLGVVFN
jgi:hypothetical protein